MGFDLLQIARDLVRANTVSSRGTGAAVDVLRPLYLELGWTVSIQEGPGAPGIRNHNLLARAPGPAEGDGVLFVTHLDTVDVGPRDLWKTDPFELTAQGDALFGLGSADVKIDAACKLLAFARLNSSNARFTRPLAFLGTFEEEVGCKGAKLFTAHPLFPAKQVVCGEPSELRIIDAHKGYVVARLRLKDRQARRVVGPFRVIEVKGRAAHSSTPHLGENAILKGLPELRDVRKVEAGSVANKVPADLRAWVSDENGDTQIDGFRLDDGLALAQRLWQAWERAAQSSSPPPDPRFSPAECVFNWGSLRSLGADLDLFFDARLLPGQKPEALLEPFLAEARALCGERFELVVEVDRSNEAMALARPSALLDAAQATARHLGLNPEPHAKPTNTEAGVFARTGAEAIVFGPGVSTNNAHCANEHTLLSQCQRAIDFYEALARRLCT